MGLRSEVEAGHAFPIHVFVYWALHFLEYDKDVLQTFSAERKSEKA